MTTQSATVRRRTDHNDRRGHGHDTSARAPSGSEIRTQDPASTESVDVIVTVLEQRFGASIPPARRREIAQQALDHYQGAPIQSYVTILAERLAIDMAKSSNGRA